MRRLTVLAAAGLISSACGGSGSGGGDGPPSSCAGTITTGDHPGDFVCYAVASYYTRGPWTSSSLITVISSQYEKTHTRPEGVKALDLQLEIAEEPLAGTYTDVTMPDTNARIDMEDGRSFDKLVGMTMTLERTRFYEETSGPHTTARIFEIHGSVSFTVADDTGSQVSVIADF
jgi:hypothetical protein